MRAQVARERVVSEAQRSMARSKISNNCLNKKEKQDDRPRTGSKGGKAYAKSCLPEGTKKVGIFTL